MNRGRATELERAWHDLRCDGYEPVFIRENSETGIVAFFDPHTLKPGWNGKRIFGLVRFSADELRKLRTALDASTQILHRVRTAERELLEGLQKGKGLVGFGVSLIFTLLMIYPIASFAS